MQVIILAGGKGTRLRSITGDALPKPLVVLHNKPLLDHLIAHVKKCGGTSIVISTGYLGEKIEEYISRTDYGIPISFSHEEKPLGTAGSLHLLKNKLEEQFVILYGDVFTTINFNKMFSFHKQKKAAVTLALHTSDHPHDSTVIQVDKKHQITGFFEKPGEQWKLYGNLTTTPLYILNKNVLQFISTDKEIDFARDVFPIMLFRKKKIVGYVTDEFAKDIGTPERYNQVLTILRT